MENFIDYIEISNFKSIRNLKLTGFKRINLFIGRPNVGKSNLLEALSLFSLSYVWEESRKLTDLVRLTNTRELFYDGDINQDVRVRIRYYLSKNKADGQTYTFHFEHLMGGLSGEIGSSTENNGRQLFVFDKQTIFLNVNSKLKITKFSKSDRPHIVKP